MDETDVDHKLPLCQSCADRLIDINEFRLMYLESHNKLKKNLVACLKYSPNQNENEHDEQQQDTIVDDQQSPSNQQNRGNNKTNNIVSMAMTMASPKKPPAKRRTKKQQQKHKQLLQQQQQQQHIDGNASVIAQNNVIFDDENMIDISNNMTTNPDLQYIILQSDTKIFNCGNCEQQFISEEFLKQHIKKAHGMVELVDQQQQQVQHSPSESVAGGSFTTIQHGQQEQQISSNTQTIIQQPQQQLIYLCHLCENRQFTSEIQLSHHMFIHSEIAAGTLTDNPFPICSCDHCFAIPTETNGTYNGTGSYLTPIE